MKSRDSKQKEWQAEKEKDDFAVFLFLLFVVCIAAISVSC